MLFWCGLKHESCQLCTMIPANDRSDKHFPPSDIPPRGAASLRGKCLFEHFPDLQPASSMSLSRGYATPQASSSLTQGWLSLTLPAITSEGTERSYIRCSSASLLSGRGVSDTHPAGVMSLRWGVFTPPLSDMHMCSRQAFRRDTIRMPLLPTLLSLRRGSHSHVTEARTHSFIHNKHRCNGCDGSLGSIAFDTL